MIFLLISFSVFQTGEVFVSATECQVTTQNDRCTHCHIPSYYWSFLSLAGHDSLYHRDTEVFLVAQLCPDCFFGQQSLRTRNIAIVENAARQRRDILPCLKVEHLLPIFFCHGTWPRRQLSILHILHLILQQSGSQTGGNHLLTFWTEQHSYVMLRYYC